MIARRALPGLLAAAAVLRPRLAVPQVDPDAALIAAARQGDAREVRRLLDAGARLNARDPSGATALSRYGFTYFVMPRSCASAV